jgi:hypothetical protein
VVCGIWITLKVGRQRAYHTGLLFGKERGAEPETTGGRYWFNARVMRFNLRGIRASSWRRDKSTYARHYTILFNDHFFNISFSNLSS